MNEIVQVEVRSVYGCDRIYPANDAAVTLAALAGKRTFSDADLKLIRELGFRVEEVANKKLAGVCS